MPGPLSKGQLIPSLDRGWARTDEHLEITSDGTAFSDVEAAEKYAQSRARANDVDTVLVKDRQNRIWVYDVDELTKRGSTGLPGETSRKAGDLQLPAGVTLQRFMVSQFGAAAKAPTHLPNRWNDVSADNIATSLRDFPDYGERLVEGARNARQMLSAAERVLWQRGQPTSALEAVKQQVDSVQDALQRGDPQNSARHLALLDEVLARALNESSNGYGRDLLLRAQRSLTSRVSPPQRHLAAPPEVLERAEALWSAYRDQTELALNAIYADGYADFIDTLKGGSTAVDLSQNAILGRVDLNNADQGHGRIRPHDAASALLRLNISIWTVLRDFRRGTLAPEAFKKSDWNELTARDVYGLALQRLKDDTIDFDDAGSAMLADPVWQEGPVRIRDPREGLTELTPGNISALWKRSIYSALAPNEAAERIEALGFARRMRDAAVAIASAPAGERETAAAAELVNSAYGLFEGRGLPANASQAVLAITTATGISVAIPEIGEPGVTREELEERREKGEIAGFAPAGPGFVVFRHKPLSQIAAEVRTKIENHELDQLGKEALQHLREMTGPASEPGALLEKRLKAEGRSRFWRELASEAITIAAIGAASGGVGAFVESVGLGAAGLTSVAAASSASRGTLSTIRAARFVANATSFTTLSGFVEGQIDPARYPADMLMFFCLGQAGRFARFLSTTPGTAKLPAYVQKALAHSTAVGSSATTLTLFTTGEMALRGHSPTWETSWQQFGRNLVLVSILHGVNTGLSRVISERGAEPEVRRLAKEHRSRVLEEASELAKIQNELSAVLTEASTVLVGSARAKQLATRAEGLLQQFAEQRQTVTALHTEFERFVTNNLSGELATRALQDVRNVHNFLSAVKRAPTELRFRECVTKEMNFDYRGEETGNVWGTKVKYLSPSERVAYEIQIVDGRFYTADGKLLDTQDAKSVFTGAGSAIFVMDMDGRIYAAQNHSMGRFHHSSFLAGEPVAAAGELVVVDGVLKHISDRSGHYLPEPIHTRQFLQRIEGEIPLEDVSVSSHFGGQKPAMKVLKARGWGPPE